MSRLSSDLDASRSRKPAVLIGIAGDFVSFTLIQMVNRIDHNTGENEVVEAANTLIDAVAYYAADNILSNERILEIRAAVYRHVNELQMAIRQQIHQLHTIAPQTIAPNELATAWGIKPEKVLDWIRRGELKAIDVSSRESRKPRYRIEPAALAEFKSKRLPTPPSPNTRRRKKAGMSNVKEFF